MKTKEERINDSQRGLYRKYRVSRLDDVVGKHNDCEYFVLDLTHDKHAAPALRAYAMSCREEYPLLFQDLINIAAKLEDDALADTREQLTKDR